MSKNLNLALRLSYDGKAVTTGTNKNVKDLNNIERAISEQKVAQGNLTATTRETGQENKRLSTSLNQVYRSFRPVNTSTNKQFIGLNKLTRSAHQSATANKKLSESSHQNSVVNRTLSTNLRKTENSLSRQTVAQKTLSHSVIKSASAARMQTVSQQQVKSSISQVTPAIHAQAAANQRLSVTQQRAMSQQGKMSRSLGLLQQSYSGVAAAITTAISVGTATMFVRDTGAAQLLDTRLKGLTDSAAQYNQVQQYLFATSDRLNTNYTTLANSYSKILNLQQAGVLSMTQGRAILEGMANAAAKTGASNVQLEQSLYGMTQGMTAGVLRAEELNQVTEPLPGLLQRLDKASGQVAGG